MSEDTTSTTGLQQEELVTKAASARKVKSTKLCNVCGRGFLKLAHLIRHVRTHGDERPFSCSKCDKAFARTDALQRHERAVHAANDMREVDDMVATAERKAGDGKDADRISRKRKRSSAGGERGPQHSSSETGSTPRSQADENSIFHQDFSHLFAIDQLQTGSKAHSQQQSGPSSSVALANSSNHAPEHAGSGYAGTSALGVPGKPGSIRTTD